MEKQKQILLTGGAGFFGDIVKKALVDNGFRVISIDLEKDGFVHENFTAIQGDIRDFELMKKIASEQRFDAIFHIAAMLAHAVEDKNVLWTSNVDGTRNIAEIAKCFNIPKVVFASSNCLWGESFDRPVTEEDAPRPIEVYGQSKWEGEKILQQYREHFHTVIFRCPTIIDAGRLGLLAMLFEFIDEGRNVWVVGGGTNRYQFVFAQDLTNAFLKALDYHKSAVFNIGSDNVPTLAQAYSYVIGKAGTKARVACLPRKITLSAMKLAYALNLSPLGPYHSKMIAESFVFDTSKIKQELSWQPTLTNEEMLYKAYQYYHDHLNDIQHRTDVSAHKQAAKMGIIRLLKWIS